MPDLLTTQQAAERLGVSASRVRQFILDGRLPATKLGRDNLIREADLSLIQNRKAGRPSTKKPDSTTKTSDRRKRNRK
jgi:excisionase family DNA binding protein